MIAVTVNANQDVAEELRKTKEKLRQLQTFLGSLGRKRQNYPDAERDPRTGRTLIACLRCGETRPLRARGLCNKCYMAWYRRVVLKPRKKWRIKKNMGGRINTELGGIPVTIKEIRSYAKL